MIRFESGAGADGAHPGNRSRRSPVPSLERADRALSAEATTAFGLSPALIIHDEHWSRSAARSSPLYEALETAVGAREGLLSIIISTQAATDR